VLCCQVHTTTVPLSLAGLVGISCCKLINAGIHHYYHCYCSCLSTYYRVYTASATPTVDDWFDWWMQIIGDVEWMLCSTASIRESMAGRDLSPRWIFSAAMHRPTAKLSDRRLTNRKWVYCCLQTLNGTKIDKHHQHLPGLWHQQQQQLLLCVCNCVSALCIVPDHDADEVHV